MLKPQFNGPGHQHLDLALTKYRYRQCIQTYCQIYRGLFICLIIVALQIVAYDFGIKHNILRRLASFGAKVTVVPANYPAEKAMELHPDGVFFSNGPVSSQLPLTAQHMSLVQAELLLDTGSASHLLKLSLLKQYLNINGSLKHWWRGIRFDMFSFRGCWKTRFKILLFTFTETLIWCGSSWRVGITYYWRAWHLQGDPSAVPYAVEIAKTIIGQVPTFGICMGHQVMGQAFGADTFKLKFGHHGGNHPIRFAETGMFHLVNPRPFHFFLLPCFLLDRMTIQLHSVYTSSWACLWQLSELKRWNWYYSLKNITCCPSGYAHMRVTKTIAREALKGLKL